MPDTSAVKKIVDKIQDSSNVLVTVNANPSVDELSAALGITLLINKLNKHATAVFSGAVPPAIEFLNPEKTFENTVDSLRDFIIALDKEKADHLRYKVDGDMVKIFITPYRTTINQDDLDFSQGDYNVEAVLAIGVKNEQDLDHALESHGRILHDATVAAISLGESTNLGGIEWADGDASSYSEMLYLLADELKTDKKLIDEQIANAFLTGIVAATDRFSNAKTTSAVMTIAAHLMAAGANQQLIATKLQEERAISTPAAHDAHDGDLTEGESARIDKSENSSKKAKKADKNTDDGVGALSISHVPEGTVDEVAKEVGQQKSQEAVNRAEEELAKQAKEVQAEKQEDATEAAEKKLAEELAATAPAATSAPTATELQQQLTGAAQNTAPPLHGAVDTSTWKSHSEENAGEPMLGGVLNATTEQAEEDTRRAIEDDRNKTILSHNGSSYAAAVPSFQSPLNATAAQSEAEPEVHDIFEGSGAEKPTARVETIQPPAPVASPPTLAEIDAQNRSAHNDARAAIDAALSSSTQEPHADASSTAAPVTQSNTLPPLPPLPPMPDFSTLPPLPGEAVTSPTNPSVPDTLGNVLPPAPADTAPAQPNDPAQFRIPGNS